MAFLKFFAAPLAIAFILAMPQCAQALDYYWVNGSGNWSAFASHWAKVPNPAVPADYHLNVPTASDDVFFTNNGGVAYTVFVNASTTVPKCRNMNWTTAPNGVILDGSASGRLDIYGSLVLNSNMSITFPGEVHFIAFGSASTITSNGVHFVGIVFFEGTTGGWLLNDAFFGDNRVYHTGGTLMTNDKTVTVGSYFLGHSPGKLELSDSDFITNGGNCIFQYSTADFDAGTSHIIFNSDGYVSLTGNHCYDVTLTHSNSEGYAYGYVDGTLKFEGFGILYGSSTILNNVIFEEGGLIYSSSRFNNLTLTAGKTYTIDGGTQTILPGGTIAANSGTTCNDFITIRSINYGTSVNFENLSGSNLTMTGMILQDIHAIGTNTLTDNFGINLGNNTGWAFTNECPGLPLYWIGGAGDWDDFAHWSTTSGGASCNCIPTAATNVFFDANSGFSADITDIENVNVLADAYSKNLDWRNVTGNPTFVGNATLYIYGSMYLAPLPQMTYNFGFASVRFRGALSQINHILTASQLLPHANYYFEGEGEYEFDDSWNAPLCKISHSKGKLRLMGHTHNLYTFAGNINFLGAFGSPNAELWLGDPATGVSAIINSDASVHPCCFPEFRAKYNSGKFHAMQSHIIFSNGFASVDGGDSFLTHDFWKVSFLNIPPATNNGYTARILQLNILNKLTFTGSGKGYIHGQGTFLNEVEMLTDGEINGNHTYNLLTLASGKGYQFPYSRTQTINTGGSLNVVNANCQGLAYIYTGFPNAVAKIAKTSGSLALSNVILDNVLPDLTTGATYSATNSIGLQSQVIADWNLTNPAARTLHWVDSGGNWSNSTHWSLTSGGGGGECPPTLLDNVIFDGGSGLGSADEVIIDQKWAFCRNMDWTGGGGILQNGIPPSSSNKLDQTLEVFGSLKFTNSMVNDFDGLVMLRSVQPAAITSGGNHFKGSIYFWEPAGQWSLTDPLFVDWGVSHLFGKFNTNNQPIVVVGVWSAASTDISTELFLGSSTLNIFGQSIVNTEGANINYQAGKFHCGTSHFILWTSLSTATWHDFYNVSFKENGSKLKSGTILNKLIFEKTGSIENYGNIHEAEFYDNVTFYDSRNYHKMTFFPGKRYTFQAGTTQTIVPFNGQEGEFNAVGLPGQYIEMKSTSFTSNANIAMDDSDGDNICTQYLFLTAMTHSGTTPTSTKEDIYVPTPGGNVLGSIGWLFFPCNPCPATIPTLNATSSTISICLPGSATLVLAGLKVDETVIWYDDAAATNIVYSGGNYFQPVITANKTYYAKVYSDGGLCYSTVLLTVNVTAIPLPGLFTVTGGGQVCLGSPGAAIGLDGSELGVSYQLQHNGADVGTPRNGTGSAIGFGNYPAAGTYTVTATLTANGCTRTMTGSAVVTGSTAEAPGILLETNAPLPNCTGDLTLSETVGDGILYAWTGPNGFTSSLQNVVIANPTAANLGTYTLVVTDAAGCSNSADLTITQLYQDAVPPTAICQNATLFLSAGGTASLLPTQIDNGSSDACGAVTLGVSPSLFDCGDVGIQTVTLTVTDLAGLSATCMAQVTVQDNIAPAAVCHAAVTLPLGTNGMATLLASQVNNGSSDNCGVSLSVPPNMFNCEDIGPHTVTLTATDPGGLTSTCQTIVNVADDTPPTAVCKNATVFLNASGTATVTEAMIDDGSFDNCGVSLSVSPSSFTCANLGLNTVTLTVTDPVNLSSTCMATVTVQDNTPPTALCQNITVNLDASGNASVSAAQVNNGSSDNCGTPVLSIDPSMFTCADVDENPVTLTATAGGLSSTCNATVTVQDITPPTAICQNITVALVAGQAIVTAAQINNVSTDNCGIASLSLNQTIFTCANAGTNNVTLTVTDVNGLSSTCTATVSLQDNTPPTALCQNLTVQLDASGNASIIAGQVNNGSSDNCAIVSMSVSPNTFTCANIGTNPVTLTVVDGGNLSNTCTATVTVQDNTPPTALCQNLTIQLNASGNAAITAAQVNNGSSDNCGVPVLSVNPAAFVCANVGANTVTLTAMDAQNLSSTCTATVTVQDLTPPTATCQNITVPLVAGQATVTATQINNGSTDNCGIASLSLNQTIFTCANAGSNNVTLTVTDVNGLSSTCSATVSLQDNTPPTALCQNLTVQLDASGNASIIAGQVNNGSSDNCAIVSMSVNPNTFTCANLGTNPVTLTITDGGNLSNTCIATVTVQDNSAPTALCQNITVQLNASGNATITAAQVNNGSFDNCGIVSMNVNPNTFTCVNIGANLVTLTVFDGGGLSGTCIATVTGTSSNAGVTLIASHETVPQGQQTCVNVKVEGFTDIVSMQFSMNFDPTIVTFSGFQGFNLPSLGGSNFGTSQAVNGFLVMAWNEPNFAGVTVPDGTAIFQACFNAIGAPGSTSLFNFSNIPTAIEIVSGDCITPVTLDNGSISILGSCTLTCNSGLVFFPDGNCNTTISVSDIINTTTCSGTFTLQVSDALGNVIGTYSSNNSVVVIPAGYVGQTLIVTVTNQTSGTACTTTVQVQDNLPPTALCQNVTLNLNASGNASLSAAQIDNGSSDNCGIVSMSVNPATFTCANIGANAVVLTVFDGGGLSGTCSATVTVQDIMPPNVICQNVTVQLNASGNASVTAAQVNNGSFDNCGVSLTLSPSTFTCANIGTNTVILTATDAGNLSNNCTVMVTVQDLLPPTAICHPVTVSLGANGLATVAASQVNNGSFDNCAIASLSVSPANFNCNSIGNQAVTLTVTDVHGLTGTCQSIVTVTDNLPPTALCQAATVTLNANGTAFVSAAQINNGSFDNCGVANIFLSPGTFDCDDVGVQIVTLTVTDLSGLASTCQASVTVEDGQVPTVSCQNISISLGMNGTVNITPQMVSNGAGDNCNSNLIMSLSQTQFGCDNVGSNAVTLTVTDAGGNSTSCTANVEVVPYLIITGIAITHQSCPGTTDGAIVITANTPFPGQHQVSYSINGGASWNLTGEFIGLSPGSYNVVVRILKTSYCLSYETAVVNPGSTPPTWYKDIDTDGYSDGVSLSSCFQSEGFFLPAFLIATTGDCNDYDPLQFPGQTWHKDMDNDGYGDGQTLVACAPAWGYKAASLMLAMTGDCNDGNGGINPAATESCNNLDDNCNGQVDEGLSGLTYVGNVTFSNQAAVNAWSQCYSVIDGNLLIQNSSITSLSSLVNLVEVTGNVTIKLTNLENLGWLINLDNIGGTLKIHNNSSLSTLNGLQNLDLVNGTLLIYQNFSLSDCCAIHDLINGQNGKQVNGTLSIYQNDTGCDNVTEINIECNPNQLILPPNNNPAVIIEHFILTELDIYPNPASNELNLYFPNEILYSGEVITFDLLRKNMISEELKPGLKRHIISIEELPRGVYFVYVLEKGEAVWVEKIIKQ